MMMPAPKQNQPVLENDPFAMPPAAMNEVQESFGKMNFNQPNSSNEEEKAQAAIDNILGMAPNSAPVEAAPVDTNQLFAFAGMDTNRNDSAQAFDFSAQPAPAQPAPANNNANNALDGFM